MQLNYVVVGTVTLILYLFFFVLWLPKYSAAQIVPYYVTAWAINMFLVLFLLYRARWTAGLLSNLASVCVILVGSLLVLGGFTRLNPSPATAAAPTLEEYKNDDPGPLFIANLILSSASGPNTAGAGFPATIANAWMMFIVPATYLIANAAWRQPPARFLKVALLNFYLLLQGAAYAYWSVTSRDRNARSHFFAVRDLGAERDVCDRILSLLLPPTIMASRRGPSAASVAEGRRGPDGGGDEILGADLVGVVSMGEERFAERFPDASVMFAMGERKGRRGGISHAGDPGPHFFSHRLNMYPLAIPVMSSFTRMGMAFAPVPSLSERQAASSCWFACRL